MVLDKVVFICFMFFSHTEASLAEERSFYVSEKKFAWTEMGNICSVGEPSFHFFSGTYIVGNGNIKDIEKDGVWVGYFEVMEYFYYVGCLTKDQVQNAGDVTAFHSGGSPGYCYRQCGHGEFFGLMKSKCVCFQKDHTLLNVSSEDSVCNRRCKYQQGVACGGPKSLSVYKFHSVEGVSYVESDTNTNNDMFCLRLNPLNFTYSWTNCKEDHAIVCDFGGEKYIQTSRPPTLNSWIDSAQKCFSEHALMLPVENNISTIAITNYEIWTKLIKSPVIYPFNSYYSALFKAKVIRYGYVARQGNRYILIFTADTSNRNVLCVKELEAFSKLETVVGISVAAGVLVACVFSFLILKRRKKINPRVTLNLNVSKEMRQHLNSIRRQEKESKANMSESCDTPAENRVDTPTASQSCDTPAENRVDTPTASLSQNLPSSGHDDITNSYLETIQNNYELITDEVLQSPLNHNYYTLENINKTENVGGMACAVSALGSSHDGAKKQLELEENTAKEKEAKTCTRSDLRNEGKATEHAETDSQKRKFFTKCLKSRIMLMVESRRKTTATRRQPTCNSFKNESHVKFVNTDYT